MARKETVNTFTNGLISDLNPINTPNTVLTDCLNGTLITYDGNEYSLQNDKGNFPLKDCKLQENYIPVGVKEYGDILYIVSYNPITKHVQIGSYPSPETNFNSLDKTAGTDNNLSYNVPSLWDGITETRYSDLTENLEKLKLFYGPIPEDYKLNPGDKYKVLITDGNRTIPNLDLGTYEGIEFYIFDENRKPYDITKDIEINTENHVYTNWKVPGYVATKLRFAQVDDFKVNVRKIIVPTYHTNNESAVKELSLNFQYFISDYLYNNHISKAKEDLLINIDISSTNTNGITTHKGVETCSINDTVDLKNGTICYYSNWSMPGRYSFNSNDTITLVITPFVKNHSNSSKRVKYNQFERTITFDLAQKGNVEDFEIGSGLWRYTVDDQLTLFFDTAGIQETSVLSEDVELQYKIRRVSDFSTSSDIINWYENQDGWSTVYDWNVVGDSILKINFDPWNGTIETSNNHYYIYAEDYYRIAFRFVNPEDYSKVLRNGITKTILATKLLNGNSSKRYNRIYFDEWINNYADNIKNKYVNVAASVDTSNQTTFIERDKYYSIWMSSGHIDKYPTFKSILDEIDSTTNPNPEFTITGGINFNTSVTYTSDLELPIGPLWQGLSANINYTDISQKSINSTTGKVNNTNPPIESQINRLEKKLQYSLRDSSIIDTLCNFTESPISISPEAEVVIEANGIYEGGIDKASGGLPDPDLQLKISGVAVNKLVTDTSSYFSQAPTQLLSKLNNYDMLFVTLKIGPQTTGDSGPNYNSLRFKTGDTLYADGDTVFACASNSTGSTTYYAVIKIKDTSSGKLKLLFIPIGANSTTQDCNSTYHGVSHGCYGYNAVVTSQSSSGVNYNILTTWAQDIKHFKGDGTKVIGGFYKAIERKTDNNSQLIYIVTTPSLSFNSWNYLNKNLFSETERNTISTDDNFFRTKGDSDKISLLSGITFDSQTTELSYSGSTTELDNLLQDEKTLISERNTQVENEIYDASNDINLNKYKDDPDLDIFIDDTNENSLIVKFLNKTQTCDTPIMFVTSDNWNPPKYNSMDYDNNVYDQYNYMGVVEVGFVINSTP